MECLEHNLGRVRVLDKDWDREKIMEYAKRFTWDKVAEETMGIS